MKLALDWRSFQTFPNCKCPISSLIIVQTSVVSENICNFCLKWNQNEIVINFFVNQMEDESTSETNYVSFYIETHAFLRKYS